MSEKTSRFCACLLAAVFLVMPSVGLGEVLLIEDFNDDITNDFVPMSTGWQVTDGLYRCDADNFGGFFLSMAGDCSWTDYSVECDIKVEGSINQVLVFRIQDPYNFYDINLRGAPYNDVILCKVVNGIDAWYRVVDFENSIGTWHHIRVSAAGNLIEVEIDGIHLFQQIDGLDPYLCGGIALAGFSGGDIGWQTAFFDNVIVAELGVTVNDQNTLDEIKALFR